MMIQIDFYLSVLSPWVYFSGNRLEEIAAKHAASIAYKPVDVLKVFEKTGGLPPAQRPPARLDYRLQELRRASAKTGMPYHEKPAHWPTNPEPSSTAILALAAQGGDVPALIRAITRAVWVEQRDIADAAVMADLLAAVGAGDLTPNMWAAQEDQYNALTEEAVEKGAFGVPFYMIGQEKFWGQDRLDDVDWHLSRL